MAYSSAPYRPPLVWRPSIAQANRLNKQQPFEAERPGTEILHPVAVVIFSGLISSTLLDTFLTPAMFWLFGRRAAERLAAAREADAL